MIKYDYYLAIKNFSSITKIDLNQLPAAKEIFSEPRHQLQNIDIFTSYFDDAEQLQAYLRQNNIEIPAGELIIVQDKNEKHYQVSGTIFKSDAYLFNSSELEQKCLDMMREPYFIESILKYISGMAMFNYQVNALNEYLRMLKAKMFDNRLFHNAKGAIISINGYLLYGNRKSENKVNYRYLHLLVSIYKETVHRKTLLSRVNSAQKNELANEFNKLVNNDSMTFDEYIIYSENIKDMQQKRRLMMEEYLKYLQNTDDNLSFEEYQNMSEADQDIDFSHLSPIMKIK